MHLDDGMDRSWQSRTSAGRPSNAASRGTRRCLNSLQGWCDGEEERVARGRSPSPCGSYYGAKRNHCERASERSIAAGAAACRAATGGLAPRRTQAQGVRTNPRRMNRRRAASSPQPQAMHSRSKKQNGTPPVLRGRALMRRTVRCVWRWVIQFWRPAAMPCHRLESSL